MLFRELTPRCKGEEGFVEKVKKSGLKKAVKRMEGRVKKQLKQEVQTIN